MRMITRTLVQQTSLVLYLIMHTVIHIYMKLRKSGQCKSLTVMHVKSLPVGVFNQSLRCRKNTYSYFEKGPGPVSHERGWILSPPALESHRSTSRLGPALACRPRALEMCGWKQSGQCLGRRACTEGRGYTPPENRYWDQVHTKSQLFFHMSNWKYIVISLFFLTSQLVTDSWLWLWFFS